MLPSDFFEEDLIYWNWYIPLLETDIISYIKTIRGNEIKILYCDNRMILVEDIPSGIIITIYFDEDGCIKIFEDYVLEGKNGND